MHQPTLEIIIPVYNEEANIGKLIHEIYAQSLFNYRLIATHIYSDQSTDQTEFIVKDLIHKYSNLKLHKNKKRLGKYYTLDTAFRRSIADFVLTFDADIHLDNHRVINGLVRAMQKNRILSLAVPNEIYHQHSTLEGRVVSAAISAWNQIRLTLPDNNAWHYLGIAAIYRGTFARELRIPRGLLDPHLYIYLKAMYSGGFLHLRHLRVWGWSIGTIADYRRLMRRSLGKPDPALIKRFGTTPDEVYAIPLLNKLKGFWQEIVRNPFFGPPGILLSYLMARYASRLHEEPLLVWEIVQSTKKKTL